MTSSIVNLKLIAVLLLFFKNVIFSHGQELVFTDSGRLNEDRFGRTVKISGDGRTMAVGAYTAKLNGVSNAGFVRLYTKSGTSWSSLQQFNGHNVNQGFGFSVDLSHDGSTLAAVATNGAFYVYELPNNSSSYELLYSTGFPGAWEIAVSSDGNTIGVTSTNDKAAMYQRNGDSFQQKGSDFLGYGRNGDISLNSDGSIAVVGDPNGSSGAGRAGVFQWINDGESMKWVQMGTDIIGVGGDFGYFGAVSMTYDGMTVSVGSLYYDNSKGLVRVYRYDETGNTWKRRGGDLIGDNSGQRFSKPALSSDGTYLLVGAGTGNYFQMFQWNGTNYETFGEKVYGEGGYFGSNVDMSADGSTAVIGAYFHNGKGKIYMYLTSVPALAPIEITSLTPSAPPSLRPTTPSGNGSGDPHFTTFAGTSFDYHGECDLVMLSSPGFASGTGLSLHIRTTRVDGRLLSYSYISGAAVGVGNSVLEVQEDGTLFVNGVRHVGSSTGDGKHNNSFPIEFATYAFTKNMIGKKKKITQYVLNLTDTINDSVEDELKETNISTKPILITIHVNPRTSMLFVKVDGNVHDSVGLLGKPLAGDRLLGRDGVTDISHSWNEFGEEWQVRDTEPKLFREHRAPQYPDACIYVSDGSYPKKTHNLRRRLLAESEGDNSIVSRQAANDACADYIGVKKEHCVYDVMVMGDLEVAEDPSYNG